MAYAGTESPAVVDLGSGTGLSTRWAAGWAARVIGIEPNDDMRAQAEARPLAGVTYREGTAAETGLESASADIVLAVQAMHWMEPVSTLAEVARLVRPGGVFAAVDADWPPVSGVPGAELAWRQLHRRVRVFEARASRRDTDEQLRRPIDDDDAALADDDLTDPHRNRSMPGGITSWSKSQHLERIERSGAFEFVREVLFDQVVPDQPVGSGAGAERFIALMRSQGSYQGLRRMGLDDDEIGATEFERQVHQAYADRPTDLIPPMSFSWRARIGLLCRGA
jgi:SAM-dependent methyltransferase